MDDDSRIVVRRLTGPPADKAKMFSFKRQPRAADSLGPILATALDAVVVMDADGRVADWNGQAETTFGWSKDEAVGRLVAELVVPPELRAAHHGGLQRYLATGEGPLLRTRIEVSALDRDGRRFPVELSITPTLNARKTLFLGFLRDITDRREAEQLLARQAREADLLFQMAVLASESGSFEDALHSTLRAICDLLGWPLAHAFRIEGAPPAPISAGIWYPEESDRFGALKEASSGDAFSAGAGLPGAILGSGEPLWIPDLASDPRFKRAAVAHQLGLGSAFAFPIMSSGRVVAILEFFSEGAVEPNKDLLLLVKTVGEQIARVFEREQAEALLEESQAHLRQAVKMEAVGQLTGGLAHDFNNLLAIVVGNLDLLEPAVASDPAAREQVETALAASLKGAEMTRQLLAFSRRQPLRSEAVALNELVEGMEPLLRRTLGESITVALDLAHALHCAQADPSQVEAVLLNLSINARDAMPGGGRLTIQTKNQHLDLAYAENNPGVADGDYVLLSVSDSGTGIAPEHLDKVFEPFFTTKEVGQGSGLGLSMLYGFAKQSGGHVKIYSELGHGTTVRLYLPVAEAAAASQTLRAAPQTIQGASGDELILVVEDNADVRKTVVMQLSSLGYRTVEAASALEAMQQVEAYPNLALVFTDVVMPGGMNGAELGHAIREIRPDLPVLYTSGFAEAALAQSGGHEIERLHLLSKPYRREDLARMVRETLTAS